MSIITTLFGILGVIVFLIGIVVYKKRDMIKQMLIVRAHSRKAMKELENDVYMKEYESVLREELPKAMREKASRDIHRKYNKSSLSEKLGKMYETTQENARQNAQMRAKNPNYKSGFEGIMDDMNAFKWNTTAKSKPKKTKKSESMRDL